MKRLLQLSAILGLVLLLQGCAVYPYPYSPSVAYYGYGPYNGYNYGYQPYRYRPHNYYGYQPYRNFGWGGGYGRSHGRGGFGWGGGYGGGRGYSWGGGHGYHR